MRGQMVIHGYCGIILGMTRLNQAVQSSETEPTGQHPQEKVKGIAALQSELADLESKIAADLAKAGTDQKRARTVISNGWKTKAEHLRAQLNEQNPAETSAPTAEAGETTDEAQKNQRLAEKEARQVFNERRRNRFEALQSTRKRAEGVIDKFMLGGVSVLTIENPELDNAYLDREEIDAELKFLDDTDKGPDEWKQTEEYRSFQEKRATIKAKYEAKTQPVANQPEVAEEPISLEAKILSLKGDPSTDSLERLEENKKDLESLAEELRQTQTSSGKEKEVLNHRVNQIKSLILILDLYIGIRKSEKAATPVNNAETPVLHPDAETIITETDIDALFYTRGDKEADLQRKEGVARYKIGQLEAAMGRLGTLVEAQKNGNGNLYNSLEVKKSRIEIALADLENRIAKKQKNQADPVPTPAAAPEVRQTRKTLKIEELGADMAVAEQNIPTCRWEKDDDLEKLEEKAKKLDEIVRELHAWGQQKEVKALDLRDASKLKLHKLSMEASTMSRELIGKIYYKKLETPTTTKTPEQVKSDKEAKYDSLLESIAEGQAPYGNSLENLMRGLSANPDQVPDGMINSAEKEIKDLLEMATDRGIDNLLRLQRSATDKRKYVRKYLERIHTFARKLDLIINRPEKLKEMLEKMHEDAGMPHAVPLIILSTLEKARLEDFNDLLERFLFMCKDKKIPFTKEVDEDIDLTALTATTTPTPNPTPAPTPTPTPAAPRSLRFEEVVIMPVDVPTAIADDIGFNEWFEDIEQIFNQRNYEAAGAAQHTLEHFHAFYQEQEATLKVTRDLLAEGRLDKALGIKAENLDKDALDDFRENVFQKIQYSLFEKGESARQSLDQIIRSVEKAKRNEKEIKDLENRVKTREKVLKLGRREKVSTEDAIELNEESKKEFIQTNIDFIEDFLEDMQNNFVFYAKGAENLKADNAQDDVYDRYKGAHGKDTSRSEKLGLLSRAKARIKAQLGRINIFRNKSVFNEMSERQEGKNQFWNLLKILRENNLVPPQQGTKFREGAIVQANEKMMILRKYIDETFNARPSSLSVKDREDSKKLFEALYQAQTHNKTQSMEYQRKARDTARVEEKEMPPETVEEEVTLINSEISASDDWVTRTLGRDNPELVAETKKELFKIQAAKFAADVQAIKANERETNAVLAVSAATFKKLQADWFSFTYNLADADQEMKDKVDEVHRIFLEKESSLEQMRIKKGIDSERSRLAAIVDRHTYVLEHTDTRILSFPEKQRLASALIAEIEARIASRNLPRITVLAIRRAEKTLRRKMQLA